MPGTNTSTAVSRPQTLALSSTKVAPFGKCQFCTGTGATFRGTPDLTTWDALKQQTNDPQVCHKSHAKWIIPSALPDRSHNGQRKGGIFWAIPLDIDQKVPDLSAVRAVLDALLPGCEYIIHSTASASAPGHEFYQPQVNKQGQIDYNDQKLYPGGYRWRVFVPLAAPLAYPQWHQLSKALNAHFVAQGFTMDGVSKRAGQLSFTATVNIYADNYYEKYINETGAFLTHETWPQQLAPLEPIVVEAPQPPIQRNYEANPNFEKLFDHIGEVVEHDKGWLIDCPWHVKDHTTGGIDALLRPPHPDNNMQGGFVCMHSSHYRREDETPLKNIGHVYAEYKLNPKIDAAGASAQAFGERATLPDGTKPAALSLPKPLTDTELLASIAQYDPLTDENTYELQSLVGHVLETEAEAAFYKVARAALGHKIGGVGKFDQAAKALKTATNQYHYDQARQAIGGELVAELQGLPLAMTIATPTRPSRPVNNLANVEIILRELPGFKNCVAYDELADCVVWLRKPPFDSANDNGAVYPRPQTDNDITALRSFFDGPAVDIANLTKTDAKDTVLSAALFNRFNPLQDYLNRLTWDGTPRLDTWLQVYAGVENSELDQAYGRISLIGAVARALKPGTQFETVLTLVGAQAMRKTSLLRALGGDWYTKGVKDIKTPDAYRLIAGNWIIETAEFKAFKGEDDETIKDFIDEREFDWVPKYSNIPVTKKCSHALFATLNPKSDGAFLTDTTGNRRILPVTVTRPCDVEGFEAARDMILAEAVTRFKNGEAFHFEPDSHLNTLAKERQSGAEHTDPWHDLILQFLARIQPMTGHAAGGRFFRLDDIMGAACLGIPIAQQNKKDRSRIIGVLTQAGIKKPNKIVLSGVRTTLKYYRIDNKK